MRWPCTMTSAIRPAEGVDVDLALALRSLGRRRRRRAQARTSPLPSCTTFPSSIGVIALVLAPEPFAAVYRLRPRSGTRSTAPPPRGSGSPTAPTGRAGREEGEEEEEEGSHQHHVAAREEAVPAVPGAVEQGAEREARVGDRLEEVVAEVEGARREPPGQVEAEEAGAREEAPRVAPARSPRHERPERHGHREPPDRGVADGDDAPHPAVLDHQKYQVGRYEPRPRPPRG